MSNFNQFIKNKMGEFNDYLLEQPPVPVEPAVGVPVDPVMPPIDPAVGPAVDPAAAAPPEKQLSSEGKVFMVDLARQALAFDPGNIEDPGILDIEVNKENAEKVESMIRNLVERENVPRSAGFEEAYNKIKASAALELHDKKRKAKKKYEVRDGIHGSVYKEGPKV